MGLIYMLTYVFSPPSTPHKCRHLDNRDSHCRRWQSEVLRVKQHWRQIVRAGVPSGTRVTAITLQKQLWGEDDIDDPTDLLLSFVTLYIILLFES
jgi:hypothetical protein